MLPINWNPGAREVRSFARIWLPLFVAVAGAMVWRRAGSLDWAIAVWAGGGVVALGCLASQIVARRVFVGLQVVAYPIGATVSLVGLAALFYLVITPIAWGMRLAGRDPLQVGRTGRSSHWVQYNQVDDPERAFRQF
jgi:hypothetical protein